MIDSPLVIRGVFFLTAAENLPARLFSCHTASLLRLPRHHRVPCVVLRSTTSRHFSPRARHARVVQHSSSRPEVRLHRTARSRARLAPRSPPRPRARRCPSVPERETLPYARQSRRFVARSRGAGTIERRRRARSASRRARLSSRITVARLTVRPRPPHRSQTRARGGSAEATRPVVGHHGHARRRLRHDQGVVPRGRLVRGPEVLEEEHAARVRVPGRGERHHLQLQPAGGAEAARAHPPDPQPGVVRQLPRGKPGEVNALAPRRTSLVKKKT